MEETFTSEARGAVLDYFWYAMDTNDESSDLTVNATCDTSTDCDGNGVTMCCVNIITTSKNGAMDQMYRCMNRGVAELSFEQTYTSDSGDDMYVNMKCLADSANLIKAGLATALVIIVSLYWERKIIIWSNLKKETINLANIFKIHLYRIFIINYLVE